MTLHEPGATGADAEAAGEVVATADAGPLGCGLGVGAFELHPAATATTVTAAASQTACRVIPMTGLRSIFCHANRETSLGAHPGSCGVAICASSGRYVSRSIADRTGTPACAGRPRSGRRLRAFGRRPPWLWENAARDRS